MDEENRFRLSYSDYFAIDPDPAYPFEPQLGLLLVEPDFYFSTNLNEAYFLIFKNSDPEAVESCGEFGLQTVDHDVRSGLPSR